MRHLHYNTICITAENFQRSLNSQANQVPYETQLLSGVYRCTCSLASISEAYSISRRVKGNQVIWNSRMTHGTNSSTSQILKSRNYGYFSKRSCLSGLTVIDTLASTLWSSRGWSLVVTQKNLKRRSHIQSHAHTRANTWHTCDDTHAHTYIYYHWYSYSTFL